MKKRIVCFGAALLFALCAFAAGCEQEPVEEMNVSYSTPEPTPVSTATPAPEATATPEVPADAPATPAPDTPQQTPRLDGVAEPGDILPAKRSYEEYKAINQDVIGWIVVPNTQIDYPVVRGTDNEYYLNHTVEKKESVHGAIYMDFRNADPLQQKHIIIYGHNMKNGTMFHDLGNYKQRDFFDENRTITFIWDGVETVWEVYLAYTVKPGIYHIHTRFGTDSDFARVMNEAIEYSKNVTPSYRDESVTIRETDQVLTLSTCTYEYDDSYFAVCARRVK